MPIFKKIDRKKNRTFFILSKRPLFLLQAVHLFSSSDESEDLPSSRQNTEWIKLIVSFPLSNSAFELKYNIR